MKTNIQSIYAALAAIALFGAAELQAQQTVVTATSNDGTISEFSPDTIVIRSQTAPEPLRYSYSKTTTYVDETGAPVSIETVKSGLPVTVHYIREGDRLVANRVIVHRAAAQTTTTTTVPVAPVVVPSRVEETRTTTTTTTNK